MRTSLRVGTPRRWYFGRTATPKPRIQVTVDDELAQALARIDPAPRSKAALVRELALRGAQAFEEERVRREEALRGAQALEEERVRREEAIQYLLEIADGTVDYDFAGLQELYERRGEHLT